MGRQPQTSPAEKASLETIEKEELKRLFQIKTDRTVNSYIRTGVLKPTYYVPQFGSFDLLLFDREHICKILGLETLPDEPFLTTDEAVEIIGLHKSCKAGAIREYCKRHKIPFYTLGNAKGTKTYFLRSELESSREYKLNWSTEFPNFVAKNHFLREIFKIIMNYNFSGSLKEKQRLVMEGIILNNKNIQQLSEELNISHQNSSHTFHEGCKRMFYQISMLDFNLSRLEELTKENIQLKLENNVLVERVSEFTKEEIPIEKQKIEHLSKTITDSNMSVRILGLLKRMEVKTLYDLTMFTRNEVEKYRNVGKKTIDGVESLLKQHGFDWKKEPELPMMKSQSWKIRKPYKKTDLRDVKTRLVEIEENRKNKKK